MIEGFRYRLFDKSNLYPTSKFADIVFDFGSLKALFVGVVLEV